MADERTKTTAAISKLQQLGFKYNDTAQEVIDICDAWYMNEEKSFHTRKNLNGVEIVLQSLNFAKRCCADDANLCEIVEINAGEDTEKFEGVLDILDRNRFQVMYRKQLERVSATGTVGAYLRLKNAEFLENGRARGGEIRINYVSASGIIPITVENEEILECAFVGTALRSGKMVQVLVIFMLDDTNRYKATTYTFDQAGKMIEEPQEVQLGDVKPFAIMRTAEVNNLREMDGYGLPRLYGAIPALKVLDLCWNILHGDLEKGDKLMFINELLAEIKKDENGNPMLSKQQKELFILLGEHLPDQKTLIYEYNPEIRVDKIEKTLELCLSMLSMSFGYGTKKYTFENGQIKTATEYIGERQDEMQELNKQRQEAKAYIVGIARAIIWFSNTFHGTTWNTEEEICVEFDDSFIIDRETEIASMRQDAISFPEVKEFMVQYVMMRLNCDRKEALKFIAATPEEVDETED